MQKYLTPQNVGFVLIMVLGTGFILVDHHCRVPETWQRLDVLAGAEPRPMFGSPTYIERLLKVAEQQEERIKALEERLNAR